MRSCCVTQGAQSGAQWCPRGVGWGEAQEGGDMCIITTDSHCCMAGTNTTLWKLKKYRRGNGKKLRFLVDGI